MRNFKKLIKIKHTSDIPCEKVLGSKGHFGFKIPNTKVISKGLEKVGSIFVTFTNKKLKGHKDHGDILIKTTKSNKTSTFDERMIFEEYGAKNPIKTSPETGDINTNACKKYFVQEEESFVNIFDKNTCEKVIPLDSKPDEDCIDINGKSLNTIFKIIKNFLDQNT